MDTMLACGSNQINFVIYLKRYYEADIIIKFIKLMYRYRYRKIYKNI